MEQVEAEVTKREKSSSTYEYLLVAYLIAFALGLFVGARLPQPRDPTPPPTRTHEVVPKFRDPVTLGETETEAEVSARMGPPDEVHHAPFRGESAMWYLYGREVFVFVRGRLVHRGDLR